MTKASEPRSVFPITLLALIFATPQVAHAYVDPGSGSMLWQLAAATAIGSLFYVRRVFTWVREHIAFRSTRNADKHSSAQGQTVDSGCSR